MRLTMPRSTAAVLVAAALAFAAAPAMSAEIATPDDTARFLAGLPPAAGSPLDALTKNPTWQQHARRFDSLFSREEKNQLAKIRAFSEAHLTEKHDVLLYLFSGPDFLYATTFFPSASTYVLAGLEPVGPIPQLTSLGRPAVDHALGNMEISLNSLLTFSFFITHKMRTELTSGAVNGTLPILYVFLARTGKTVHEVSLVSLDADGNIQSPDQPAEEGNGEEPHKHAKRPPPSAAKGVKIIFSDGDHANQTLYYFSTNLADGSVDHSGFLTFCDKLGTTDDSFIKSASYLMHGGGFTTVRRFILDHSAAIVEDDSGIPLAYFDPKKWRLQPYGRYVGPLNIFSHHYQPQLTQLFHRANTTPLDFSFGYQWKNRESSLLVAERTAPVTADAESTASASPPEAPGPKAQSRGKHENSAGTSRSHRKRAENNHRNCRYWGYFSFCSAN
jgi:hypothetical protein